ncbi:MAG TPA: hypothetical protein VIF14_07435 [Alphaproteobacteria bacterium]
MTDPAQIILSDLAAEFAETRWFARLGQKPSEDDRRRAADYCAKLGFKRTVQVWLHDLGAAEGVLQRDEAMPEWQRAERDAAASLTRGAAAVLGESAANAAVNRAMLAASDAALRAARLLFPAQGRRDEALMRVAAGAAARCAGEYSLVLLAGADPAQHAFGAKQRLFAAGRWPLIAIESQFALL